MSDLHDLEMQLLNNAAKSSTDASQLATMRKLIDDRIRAAVAPLIERIEALKATQRASHQKEV